MSTDSMQFPEDDPGHPDHDPAVTIAWAARRKSINSEDMSRRLQYAGAIGLLCECSVQVDDEYRELIEQAVTDYCELTGWTWRRILDRIEVSPPEG